MVPSAHGSGRARGECEEQWAWAVAQSLQCVVSSLVQRKLGENCSSDSQKYCASRKLHMIVKGHKNAPITGGQEEKGRGRDVTHWGSSHFVSLPERPVRTMPAMRSPAAAVLALLAVGLQVAMSDVCGRKSVRDIWHGECAEAVYNHALLMCT